MYAILLARLLDLFDQHAKEIATLHGFARERLAVQQKQRAGSSYRY